MPLSEEEEQTLQELLKKKKAAQEPSKAESLNAKMEKIMPTWAWFLLALVIAAILSPF